jgi:hypothetical protein
MIQQTHSHLGAQTLILSQEAGNLGGAFVEAGAVLVDGGDLRITVALGDVAKVLYGHLQDIGLFQLRVADRLQQQEINILRDRPKSVF